MRALSRLSLVLFLLASQAIGDRGELYLDIATKPGWLISQNPVIGNGKSQNGFLEDFSLGLRYGLTDGLHLGFSFGVGSSFFGVQGSWVTVNEILGKLSSSVLGLWIPFIVSYRFNNGYDWTAVIEAQFGYNGVSWTNSSLTDQKFILIPEAELKQGWQHGWFAGLNTLAQVRMNDWFALEFGPSLSIAYLDGQSISYYPGLLLRSSFIFGAGGGL